MNICSVTILYYPDQAVLKNIETYYPSVDHLFLIDNTDLPSGEWRNNYPKHWEESKVEYIRMGSNQGIAAALNKACELALEKKYEWILTMDQDSSFNSEAFFDFAANYQDDESIGLIAAAYPGNMPFIKENSADSNSYLIAITSGNLLRLSAWQTIKFETMLFIDEVDNDFCLRMHNNGLRIIASKEPYLVHGIGETKYVNFLGFWKFSIGLHPPVRSYYITRNIFYMLRTYFKKNFFFCVNRLKTLCLITIITLFFYPEKKRHFRYQFFGLVDFMRSRYGRCHR